MMVLCFYYISKDTPASTDFANLKSVWPHHSLQELKDSETRVNCGLPIIRKKKNAAHLLIILVPKLAAAPRYSDIDVR